MFYVMNVEVESCAKGTPVGAGAIGTNLVICGIVKGVDSDDKGGIA